MLQTNLLIDVTVKDDIQNPSCRRSINSTEVLRGKTNFSDPALWAGGGGRLTSSICLKANTEEEHHIC